MESKSGNQRGRREWPGKKVSPQSITLDSFIKAGGHFKIIKAECLFQVSSNPQLDKDNFIFSETSPYPYFTRTVFNNGLLGHVDFLDDKHLIPGNSIAVGMMGMQFFYQSHDFYAGQFTKTIFPKFEEFDEKIALWFLPWFNKSRPILLGGLVRDFDKNFYKIELEVPILDGKIDFEFMRSHIRELEEERMLELEEERKLELETYLSEAGFDDCKLTTGERDALFIIQNQKCKFNYFRIGDLFHIFKGKRLTKEQMKPGPFPFIGATSVNNGKTNSIANNKFLHPANTITVNYNGSVGEAFYQSEEFWASDDVNVLYYKFHLNENIALYFNTILKKIGQSYGYSYKWTKDKMNDDYIRLPVKEEGLIDSNLIYDFINALKKLTIQKLKKEIDIENAAYKEVVPGKSIDKLEKPDSYQLAAEPFEIYGYSDFDSTSQINSEEPLLVGYFRTREQKNWILKNNLFNVRMGNRKGSMEEYKKLFDKTNILILHGNVNVDRKIRIYRLSNPREKTGKDMKELDYPVQDINSQYAIFDIEEIDNPGINKAVIVNDIKKKLGARHLKSVFLTS